MKLSVILFSFVSQFFHGILIFEEILEPFGGDNKNQHTEFGNGNNDKRLLPLTDTQIGNTGVLMLKTNQFKFSFQGIRRLNISYVYK